MGMREKDQADFDLERCIELFDEALTSKDDRVTNALRSLLMVVILTAPETSQDHRENREIGPLRRLTEDLRNLYRSVNHLQNEVQELRRSQTYRNNPGSWPYATTPGETYHGGGGYGGGNIVDDYSKEFDAKLSATKAAMIAGLNLVDPDVKP